MKRGWVVLAAVAALGLAGTARAWDYAGHEQIADIAWTRLNSKAKREVTRILVAGDPQFRPASNGEEEVRAAFRKSATFCDYIKGNRSPRYQPTIYEDIIDQENTRWHPEQDLDVSPGERVRCKTWHYYDTPIRFQGAPPPIHTSNALNALNYARVQLGILEKAPHPDGKMQAWWLYWIEHVTGDLHQPLHCVSSFQYNPTGDAGGNRFPLGIVDPMYPGHNTNLHFYWDAGIDHAVQQEGITGGVEEVTRRWMAETSAAPSAREASNLDVASWIRHGADLADQQVYTGIERRGAPSAEYLSRQASLCKHQALLAGDRLAAILNQTLGR